MEQENRVVVLIDMDCFYCQVEEKLDPELKGKPIAVVQYNPWKGGGIIAVNYVARARGVTRHMRGNEAKEKCPEIQLPSVPCLRGKADITKYREAGKEVARVLQKFTTLLERASIDEAYLDITAPVQERLKTLNINTVNTDMMPNTYALGYNTIEEFISDIHNCGSDSIEFDYDHAKRLLVGAVIVSEIRAAVYQETGYRCSAGISHNKILAKLVCGMNKPNKQTILPKHSINILYKTLSLKKVKHLGGKFGDTVCEVLKISKMGELQKFTEKHLQARFDEKNGTWLYNISRGVDLEPVQARFNPKSIGCCKQLRGKSSLYDLDSLKRWLKDLGDEIEDRLEKDAVESNRTPKQMVVSFTSQGGDGRDASSSRSYNFVADDELGGELFATKALELVLDSLEGVKYTGDETNRKLRAPIKFLGISVGKFEDNSESKKTKKIVDYFVAGPTNATKSNEDTQRNATKESTAKKNEGKEYILQKFFNAQNVNKNKAQNTNVTTEDDAKLKESKVNTETSTVLESALNSQESFFARYVTTDDDAKLKENTVNTESSTVLESALDKQESFFARYATTDDDANLKEHKIDTETSTVLESALDKQESFFAKFLNKEPKKNRRTNSTAIRPTTPECNVVTRGDDSNDTDYSSSTINMEINKSIALFDDDPQETARVSNMRDLMNKSSVQDKSSGSKGSEELQAENTNNDENTKCSDVKEKKNSSPRKNLKNPSPLKVETFQCQECGKAMPLHMFETHADYHFALKLREEERQRVRDEFKQRTRSKPFVSTVEAKGKKRSQSNEEVKRKKEDSNKNKTMTPIASFFAKVDDTIPTEVCSECGKKVPVEKFTEHSDFHQAQKLNRELNRHRTAASTITNFSENILKRKRKTISPTKEPKLPCTSKSIDSFFR